MSKTTLWIAFNFGVGLGMCGAWLIGLASPEEAVRSISSSLIYSGGMLLALGSGN